MERGEKKVSIVSKIVQSLKLLTTFNNIGGRIEP